MSEHCATRRLDLTREEIKDLKDATMNRIDILARLSKDFAPESAQYIVIQETLERMKALRNKLGWGY